MKYATSLLFSTAFAIITADAFSVYAQDTFPSVDQATQKTRDDTRRQILQTELATEKKALEDTQQALAEAVSTKQQATKLQSLNKDIQRHSENVKALNAELAALGKQQIAVKATSPVRLSSPTTNSARDAPPAPFWDVYKRAAN